MMRIEIFELADQGRRIDFESKVGIVTVEGGEVKIECLNPLYESTLESACLNPIRFVAGGPAGVDAVQSVALGSQDWLDCLLTHKLAEHGLAGRVI